MPRYNIAPETIWQPIKTAPRDGTPILAWCDHNADPYYLCSEYGKRLTVYGAHVEIFSNHATDGLNLVVWGGAYDDAEDGYVPDWWFVNDSDFEKPANPVYWMQIPNLPE